MKWKIRNLFLGIMNRSRQFRVYRMRKTIRKVKKEGRDFYVIYRQLRFFGVRNWLRKNEPTES